MTNQEFQDIIERGMDLLPDEFKNYLQDAEIIIEDTPTPAQLSKMRQKFRSEQPFTLLGLYEGVPVGKKSVFSTPNLPAKITLFRRTIEQICVNKKDMVTQIYRTLLHEIGHHFGLSDDKLRKLGF